MGSGPSSERVRKSLRMEMDLGVDDHLGLHQSCTYRQPKRPLMQRLPRVTECSRGDVTLTISLSWTCKRSVHPTPQYPQMVSTRVCLPSSQVPACRRSYSPLNIRAAVGQAAVQLPQENPPA